MIKAIIFDVGGVLIKTVDQTPRMKLAKEFNLTMPEIHGLVFGTSKNKDPQLGIITWEEHLTGICKKLAINDEDGEDFIDMFFAGDHLDSVLIEEIEILKEKYKIGILSNAMSNLTELLTESWEIINHFEVVVNSSEEGLRKPDKRIYTIALEKLSVLPEEAIFIDDKEENSSAATELGIHGIQYTSTEQTLKDIHRILEEN